MRREDRWYFVSWQIFYRGIKSFTTYVVDDQVSLVIGGDKVVENDIVVFINMTRRYVALTSTTATNKTIRRI